MRKYSLISTLVLLSLSLGSMTPASATPWQSKVDDWVLETAADGATEFLVVLDEQADLSPASRLENKSARGRYVYRSLTAVAEHSQPPLIAVLQHMGLEYRPYWVVNALWVRGDLGAVIALAQRSDVRHLVANPAVQLKLPVPLAQPGLAPGAVEWNIALVGAPEAWALGYTGQGVVVGGADTGYAWDHPALINQYRGWDGSSVSHDYNWYDATAEHSLVAKDPQGHGTHTMGIMVGDDGEANQVGMAPGARWIGCRNMDADGYGTPETYIACYQWFIAPTRVDGVSEPRPDLAPDVINNSWACLESEGCLDPNILLAAVQSVRAAGILTVHSAGNSGSSGCSSVYTPAAIYAESFSVGATDSADVLAAFSSRGPVTVDGSGRLKPDISAPGVSVRSCYPVDSYTLMSGTSMAAPHVAGLVALLISANPGLRGQVDQVEAVIEQTARGIPSAECSSAGVPNNLYGWGRIQALEAVRAVTHNLLLSKTASADYLYPGEQLVYTLTLSDTNLLSPATGLVLTDTLPAGTSFISATQPYTMNAAELRWEASLLEAGQAIEVTLVVRVDEGMVGEVVNGAYSAVSNEASLTIGEPVVTMTLQRVLLPLTLK